MRSIAVPAIVIAAISSLCACAGAGGPSVGPPVADSEKALTLLQRVSPVTSSGKIKHVVIIIQENRSFDNLFTGFPGADAPSYGYDTKGNKIKLQPVPLETSWDLDHSSDSYFAACNGTGSFPGTDCRMNGFDNEFWGCGHGGQQPCPNHNPPYSYVPRSETKPYFSIGKQYVLADKMFASNFDASSFISHQYIIAGQASAGVNYPEGIWGCDGGPGDKVETVTQQRQVPGPLELACFENETLGDELDSAHLSWAYYASPLNEDGAIWSAYQAIKHIRNGPDWHKDVISPQTRFFKDVEKGRLRTVSWIAPSCANSDHAGCGSNHGPSWVTSLVNAVGKSKYWDSTVIFIFWDDYGGWYDNEAPALADYDGLGLRIPMLVVSAFAKKHYVSHVPYEHGSILRFVEDQFGLGRLSASDTRANSPDPDCFDFSQPPRKFVPIVAPLDENYFLHEPIDRRVPDSE